MTKFFAFFALVASFSSYAGPMNLACTVSFNADKVLETSVTLNPKERNKSFGEIDGFEFFLSENNDSTIELQALNVMEPSRSYATAKLSEISSFVDLSIWTREFLLEVRCTRAP